MNILALPQKLKKFQDIYKAEIEKLPFHFNVIDELHADENAHSRILQKILMYKQKNELPFLLSFLKNFFPEKINISSPQISFNQEGIDILIEDKNTKFACIIENKIHGAIDQDKQIERYIGSVKKHGATNIFAIYLTSSGSKTISDCSFTKKAKADLNYKNENDRGRFICLNYREHILPWLKQNVLNDCTYKNFKMFTGIIQYIDHLEGIFNIREDKAKMNKELIECIHEVFEIGKTATDKDFKHIQECKENIETFKNTLENLRQELVNCNPWNQTKEDLKIWLLNKLKDEFKSSPEPFKNVSIFDNTTTVLNRWNYKGHNFKIDISSEKFYENSKIIISFTTEGNKISNDEPFSSFFEDYNNGWRYDEDWQRYTKNYDDISNNEKLDNMIKDIHNFLYNLSNLQNQNSIDPNLN